MKNFFLILEAILIFAAIFLTQSCRKQETISVDCTSDEQQLAFAQFKSDLNSLNYELGYSNLMKTKGAGRDLTTGTADAIGGVLGNKFGGSIGITVGAAFGGWGGLAGYVIGHKYGGMVGAVLCSALVGAIYDWASETRVSGYVVPEEQAPEIPSKTYPIDDNCSFGEVHNALLSCVRSNGKEYISKDGSIMIDEIYNDIIQYANELDIKDVLCENEEYITYIKECVREISDITLKDTKGLLYDSYKNNMKRLCENKGLSSSEIDNVMDVISATEISAVLEEPQALEYEKEFEMLVDQSALSNENKALVRTAGSISIMSNNYWNVKK